MPPARYDAINFKPPAAVASAAARGLRLRETFNRGGTQVGVARARDLSNRRTVSPETISRMVSYFARHEVDSQADGWGDDAAPSAGWVAWLLWGGDAGRRWAESVRRRMQAADKRAEESMMAKEQVENPTAAQRADLPASAYAAPWFDDGSGNYRAGGTFVASKSKLPHHINTVRNAAENTSIDVPRLRNAMARFGQTSWTGFPTGERDRAMAHLQRHARSVLASQQSEALTADLLDFCAGRHRAIEERLACEAAKARPAAVHVAEADLPLLDGQTVDLFRAELEAALRKAYLGMDVGEWDFSQRDIHGDFVVVEVYLDVERDEDGYTKDRGPAFLHRVPFSRDGDRLVLGEPVPVRLTAGVAPIPVDVAHADMDD